MKLWDIPLWGWLLAVAVMNVIDAVSTCFLVDAGMVEANPLLGPVLEFSPAAFYAVKLGMVALGLFFLWRHRDYPHTTKVAAILAGIYWIVMIWQLVAWVVRFCYSPG